MEDKIIKPALLTRNEASKFLWRGYPKIYDSIGASMMTEVKGEICYRSVHH
jgi:hypothetical protein